MCEHLAAEGLGDPDGAPAERLELRGGLAGTGGGLLLELKRPDADPADVHASLLALAAHPR